MEGLKIVLSLQRKIYCIANNLFKLSVYLDTHLKKFKIQNYSVQLLIDSSFDIDGVRIQFVISQFSVGVKLNSSCRLALPFITA